MTGLISHSDVLHQLQHLKWGCKNRRRNVAEKPVWSSVMGVVMRPYHGYVEGILGVRNPEAFLLFSKFILQQYPDFRWTSITVNKNLECKAHRDKGNKGESMIIAFGDYTGGELCIDIDGVIHTVDIKEKWYLFNGKENVHWTAPFKGERFVLVYYTAV